MGNTKVSIVTQSGVTLNASFNWTQGTPKDQEEYYSVGMLALEDISVLELLVRIKRSEKTHIWDDEHSVSSRVADVVGEIVVSAMIEHFGADRFLDGLIVTVEVSP